MVWKIKKIIFIQFIQVFQILILLSAAGAVQRCVFNDVNLFCHKTANKECFLLTKLWKTVMR